MPPRSLTFPQCHSSLACRLHQHSLSSSGWRGGRYQTTWGQCPHRPPCLLCGVHGAPHVWRCAWQCYMMLLCICQPSMLCKAWRLAVMASSTSLFHHKVSCHHRWGFVVPHTSSVVFSKPVLSFAQISSVVVAVKIKDGFNFS